MTSPALVWFRKDLRLADNPALHHVAASGKPLIPLYIDEIDDPWPPGGASRWWLHQSLQSLDLKLWLRRGRAADTILQIIQDHGVDTVVWNRRYDPFGVKTDTKIKATLASRGINVRSFNGALGREPFDVKTKTGDHYRIFTPYSKAWLALPPLQPPLKAPAGPLDTMADPSPMTLDDLSLKPTWPHRFGDFFQPGEPAAHAKLDRFMPATALNYQIGRDRPDQAGVSTLSPHLHWGEITPRQIIKHANTIHGSLHPVLSFIRQLIWRDFAHQSLFHVKHLPETSLRPEFEQLDWIDDPKALQRWQQGLTGFPIVDAGMRELWTTGMMHNRVRMITGSFLTKDLRIHWRHGAAWFWDTLLDADLANNAMGWQWVSGSGIDAAPYFRIFNPTTQAKKFDPDGTYIKRWVPELRDLNQAHIHEPHQAPFGGPTAYPQPMVDHKQARIDALAAFKTIRNG